MGKAITQYQRQGKKFKRSADAVVEGRRNFLGNVVNVNGTLYFYSGGWVATSKNGKRFRLKHKKGLPGDPGIAYLRNNWYGIEAH